MYLAHEMFMCMHNTSLKMVWVGALCYMWQPCCNAYLVTHIPNTWQTILWGHIGHFGSIKDNIPVLYSNKFSRVFNFTNFENFQLFTKNYFIENFWHVDLWNRHCLLTYSCELEQTTVCKIELGLYATPIHSTLRVQAWFRQQIC